MLSTTWRRGAAVSLVTGLVAAPVTYGPASASQATPVTATMSSGTRTAQPALLPSGTPSVTLSLLAGWLAYDLGPGPATKASLKGPSGVALDARGDLLIADSGNNVVEEVTPAGRLSVVAGDGKEGPPTPGPATKSALYDPSAVAVDASGDLFIADSDNEVVEEVTPAGRLSVVAGVDDHFGPPTPGPATKSYLGGPGGVALDARGDLFIADSLNNLVEEVTPVGKLSVVAGVVGHVGSPAPGPATKSDLFGPGGMALDVHGDLFIADEANNVVEEVTAAGKLSVVAGVAGHGGPPTPGPATKSDLYQPDGVALDAHGDLFIADYFNNVVEEVTPAGRLSVVAGHAQP